MDGGHALASPAGADAECSLLLASGHSPTFPGHLAEFLEPQVLKENWYGFLPSASGVLFPEERFSC